MGVHCKYPMLCSGVLRGSDSRSGRRWTHWRRAESKNHMLISGLQTLSDFYSRNCFAPFSYVWLWMLGIISVAVYAADTFTAVNLLAFNKWSSQVKPAIDFKISKWIFAVCIILSWTLAAFEWFRAIRVIRRGSVSECYLDPIAATLQSMRDRNGWKRFLVFAELTKSKKGTDYIALFVYFSFKGMSVTLLFYFC